MGYFHHSRFSQDFENHQAERLDVQLGMAEAKLVLIGPIDQVL